MLHRFYRNTVAQILAALKLSQWVAQNQGLRTGEKTAFEVYDYIVGSRYRLNNWTDGEDAKSLDSLITDVEQNLASAEALDGQPSFDKTLIDVVVEILRLPYAANCINGKTLTALRKAILAPDEIRELKLELARKEAFCPGCNRTLQQGEMGSVSFRDGAVTIFCAACSKPHLIKCSCKKVRGVSEIMRRRLQKELRTCECGKKVEEGAVETPVLDADAPAQPPTSAPPAPRPSIFQQYAEASITNPPPIPRARDLYAGLPGRPFIGGTRNSRIINNSQRAAGPTGGRVPTPSAGDGRSDGGSQ